MKKRLFLASSILILTIFLTNNIFAQVTPGPSDTTTTAPANAASVGKIIYSGQSITIVGPQDTTNTDFAKYHWYKLDAAGNKQPATATGKTYTETSSSFGYYNYELVTENANGCTSPVSDVFKVFVLPKLNATITSPNNSVCAGVGSTMLTANAAPGYTYTYQWIRNGVNVSGATGNTYTISGENIGATVTFGVTVTYVLDSNGTATATKQILMTPLPAKPLITAN